MAKRRYKRRLTDSELARRASWSNATLLRMHEIAAGIAVTRESAHEVAAARLLGRYGHGVPQGDVKDAVPPPAIVVIEVPAGQGTAVQLGPDGRPILPPGARVLTFGGPQDLAVRTSANKREQSNNLDADPSSLAAAMVRSDSD